MRYHCYFQAKAGNGQNIEADVEQWGRSMDQMKAIAARKIASFAKSEGVSVDLDTLVLFDSIDQDERK